MEELTELAGLDPMGRAKRVGEMLADHQEVVNELSRVRREALNELVETGMSRKDIAVQLGMTQSRIGQLLKPGPQSERVLLGTGPITVAMPGKKEEERKASGVSTEMFSVPMIRAYTLLSKAASEHGLLPIDFEDIPRQNGDKLRLNRPNLIVLGSPRVMRLMEQVLGADRNLGFGVHDDRWYLTERGRTLRSPSESDVPIDYAYLGRLPRTDGRGTFLYVAGIHAMGTLGGVTYLLDNLEAIYDTVKAGRTWSVLIECRYAEGTTTVESVDRLTEFYID